MMFDSAWTCKPARAARAFGWLSLWTVCSLISQQSASADEESAALQPQPSNCVECSNCCECCRKPWWHYWSNGHERAGCPQEISCLARLSNCCGYTGCYVGGGAVVHGEPRCVDEGTWGWDYTGQHFQRRVWLGWSHGARYQGGSGAYKTDGPKVIHEH